MAKLQSRLESGQWVTLADPIDIYYLTGMQLSLGRLLISSHNFFLGVDGRYFAEGNALLPGKVVLCERGKWDALFKAAAIDNAATLLFDPAFESYSSYLELSQTGLNISPSRGMVCPLRRVKEPYELQWMKKASHAADEGYAFVLSLLKVGVTEKTVACKLKAFWLEKMGLDISFEPIIAFGEHTAYPHAKPSERELVDGDIVLIDIGVGYNQYQSDMTRMALFGKPSPQHLELVTRVFNAHEKAVAAAFPGVQAALLDKTVRDYFQKEGCLEAFSHSLGHGIGLEVHEAPSLRLSSADILEESSVITIEPGLYIPGIGGARLENTYLVTNSGLESFNSPSLEPVFVAP